MLSLLTNVPSDHLLLGCSHRLGKVAVRPEAPVPQPFLQLRVFAPKDEAAAPLEFLHHRRHAFMRAVLHQQMHVVLLDVHLTDPPPVHGRGFVEERPQSDGYFAE